ncbi:MAG: tRNA pseudouridine(13) synthase TruD [Phycisphaerales bacterium]|nr:tRNA pseudouridine(13) synthase TruD [Planctomycetota bacterium]
MSLPPPAAETLNSDGAGGGDGPAGISPRSFITADLPGIGGVIKARPEDFLVDEIPAYSPGGTGEHLYLFVEKRNLSTLEAVRVLADHFGVESEAIGFAGMKDRVAITRQLFSVHIPKKKPEDFPSLDHERLKIEWADLHTNKLRTGHLTGNRFSIRIRGVSFARVREASAILNRLTERGVPNRFGPQRFGRAGNNHLIGRALFRNDFEGAIEEMLAPQARTTEAHEQAKEFYRKGDFGSALGCLPRSSHPERHVLRSLAKGERPSRAVKTLDRSALKFFLSAFQSAVFNLVLEERLRAGSFDRLLEGDVAMKHENRACFDVDAAVAGDAATAERLRSFEISPSGPMWSAGMRRAGGEPGQIELRCLEKLGVSEADLSAFDSRAGRMIEGARRPLRVPVAYPEIDAGADEHGEYVRVAFDLPRGAFATVVLEEIMKTGLREQGDLEEESE